MMSRLYYPAFRNLTRRKKMAKYPPPYFPYPPYQPPYYPQQYPPQSGVVFVPKGHDEDPLKAVERWMKLQDKIAEKAKKSEGDKKKDDGKKKEFSFPQGMLYAMAFGPVWGFFCLGLFKLMIGMLH
jgi:hypothetical protein